MPSSTNANANANANNNKVPFFVLNLEGGKTKALFTVPSTLATTLIQHPVLCRGASFDLRLDEDAQKRQEEELERYTVNCVDTGGSFSDSTTCFLTTEFMSPNPEATASAISQRLAIRITNCEGENNSNPLSTIFGL